MRALDVLREAERVSRQRRAAVLKTAGFRDAEIASVVGVSQSELRRWRRTAAYRRAERGDLSSLPMPKPRRLLEDFIEVLTAGNRARSDEPSWTERRDDVHD